MNILNAKQTEGYSPYTCLAALGQGDTTTRLSAVVMGLGSICHGQVVKGILYLAAELEYLAFMVRYGLHNLAMLITLGEVEQQEVWDEAQQVYLYVQGDQSVLLLLYGVATLLLTLVMFLIWRGSLKSAYKAQCLQQKGSHVNNRYTYRTTLLDDNIYRLLMTPPMFFITALTILPLIFMICMAFTNYSKIDNHLVLFDWVGLENFAALFDSNSILGSTFWSVLVWTLVWAVFATFTNYIFGMLLALLINRKDTRAKGFWRFCFVLSSAVPMFVSLLIMRTMLQPNGAVNVLLRSLGLIAPDGRPAFLHRSYLGPGHRHRHQHLGGRALHPDAADRRAAEHPGGTVRGRQGGRRRSGAHLLQHYAALHALRNHPLPDCHLHRQREQLQRHLSAVRRRPGHQPGFHRRQHRPAGHLAVQADHRQTVLQCGRCGRHHDLHYPVGGRPVQLPAQQVL